ncbi:hypothetical protein KAU11_05535, partial [Candidatus Babeliales bacterium]|nr:hypothetical protein [Candidatus Babeliales bacterium]
LEALDPSQNNMFRERYFNRDIDLSQATFIATANDLNAISEPLKDRMEIITLTGYSTAEKIKIAQDYIIPAAVKKAGLAKLGFKLSKKIIVEIIERYTDEAGVRTLTQKINRLCEKFARSVVDSGKILCFAPETLHFFLGNPLKQFEKIDGCDRVGSSNGLYCSLFGGGVAKIEAVFVSGSGCVQVSGNQSLVAREAAQAAVTYVRANSARLGVSDEMFKDYDLHIHFPASTSRNDGLSAGLALIATIVSAATGKPVNGNWAMTGEIDLHGKINRVGGLKEKLLGAHRAGVKNVIVPKKNKKEAVEVLSGITGLNVVYASKACKALESVLK